MRKNLLLLIPLFLGLALLIYSWYISYPLNITSAEDSVFYHIPIYYWFGFGLLLASFFLMSITFKNIYLKWLLAIACVLTLYSLYYFYYTLPGSDAHYFRGLTLNYMNYHNLDASQFIHSYYQWPSFFILGDITLLISGLSYTAYSFVLFGIIGFLLATTIYVYGSKFNKQMAFLVVISFFLMLFYFFNFQAVPFSLAFVLFLLLFILQVQPKKDTRLFTILTIILFTGMALTHAFVPLFFILYLLIVCIIRRSKWHFELFCATLVIFFTVQITLSFNYWADNLTKIFTTQNEFGGIASQTLVSPQPVLIDFVAQIFSRFVTLSFAAICAVGFIIIYLRKKLSDESKAMFLSGIAYLLVGFVLYTLGSRAIALIFLPISLGAVYLISTKYKRYLKVLILALIVLFVFVPIHSSFNSYPVVFQTKEAATASNFMIDAYNWTNSGAVLSDNGIKWYMAPQVSTTAQIESSADSNVPLYDLGVYRCIIYSIELSHDFNSANVSQGDLVTRIYNNYDVLYSSGSTIIGVKK